jgi:serine/threonine protein phosphatase PrpC
MHVAQYNANAIIEDTYQFLAQPHSEEGSLFGVFDGHGGRAASAFCRDELLNYLDVYRYNKSSPALIDALPLEHADKHFLVDCLEKKDFRSGVSGACIAVTHIQGDTVRTASAGDCRVIVGRYVPAGTPYVLPSRVADGPVLEKTPMTDYFNYEQSKGIRGWFQSPTSVASLVANTQGMQGAPIVPVELAAMHQIDFNHYETLRLLHGHPNEADIIRNARVKGGLQPTRGFGDGTYKYREFFEYRYATRDNKRLRTWTPPYTTVTPETSRYTLADGDRFLVMSSDGLLEDMSPDMVVKYVGDYLADSSVRARYPNCGHFLIEKALLHASHRAIGKRKDEHNLSWIASVSPGDRRNVHDDVTALVVFFNDADQRKSEACAPGAPAVPATLLRMSGKAKL